MFMNRRKQSFGFLGTLAQDGTSCAAGVRHRRLVLFVKVRERERERERVAKLEGAEWKVSLEHIFLGRGVF